MLLLNRPDLYRPALASAGDCLSQRMSSVAHGLYDGAHACILVAGMWCCKCQK